MAKYRFHELKRSCPQWFRDGVDPCPLPEDVNGPVELFAERFKDADLMAMLRRVREKKLYGPVEHYNGTTGVLMASFDFQHGMCPRFYAVEARGANLFKRSIHNDNLDMRKEQRAA